MRNLFGEIWVKVKCFFNAHDWDAGKRITYYDPRDLDGVMIPARILFRFRCVRCGFVAIKDPIIFGDPLRPTKEEEL